MLAGGANGTLAGGGGARWRQAVAPGALTGGGGAGRGALLVMLGP
jgi:hypothetical protein